MKLLFFPYLPSKIHPGHDMDVIIYGLVGHAGSVRLPLDVLEIDDLSVGREFAMHGKVYEIRSIREGDGVVHLNVVMILEDG